MYAVIGSRLKNDYSEHDDTKASIFSSFLNKGVPWSMIAEVKDDWATAIMSNKGRFKTTVVQNFLYWYDFSNNTYMRWDLTSLMLAQFPVSCDCLNGNVLISGGLAEGKTPVSTSIIFDTHKQDKSVYIVGNMINARYWHSVVVTGDKAYAIGGLSTGKWILKACEVYDFYSETWSPISPM